ncbi:hypothetical protein V2J09_005990 [Rumex salicifolius]
MDAGTPISGEEAQPLMALDDNITSGQLVPRLFTSLPALDNAASYLAETTTFLAIGDSSTNEQESVTFTSQGGVPLAGNQPFTSWINGNWNALTPSMDATPGTSQSNGSVGSSAEHSSLDSGTSVASTSSGTGISLFKGLVERAKRTVRGSADDIGWLQKDPEMPAVEDGTERFTEILDSIRHGVHRLPKTMVYLLIPGNNFPSIRSLPNLPKNSISAGLFSNHGPLYFSSTKTYFLKLGLTCHMAKIHSEASVEKNARELKDYIEEIYWGSKKRVMLFGHSKGGIDTAAALSMYWPDLKDKVAGLVLAQSPYGGSPIASDILREGQLGDYVNVRKLMEILICNVIKGDMQSLEDLTYDRRREFLKHHRLPEELPVVSFHTVAKITPAVLATLSHVAHAELGQATKVPVVMPLGAVMGACAQLLEVRYGEKSDGLVTCRDAEVSGSVVVRPTRNMDHAWMVYSPLSDDPLEPNSSQVCEALLELLLEVGQKKKYSLPMKNDDNDESVVITVLPEQSNV